MKSQEKCLYVCPDERVQPNCFGLSLSCSLSCGRVSRPRFRPLNRNTNACNNLHTANARSSSSSKTRLIFLLFLHNATQRESAQVASLLERNHCNALEAVVGSTWLGGGWIYVDGHRQLVQQAGGQISKHDKDQQRNKKGEGGGTILLKDSKKAFWIHGWMIRKYIAPKSDRIICWQHTWTALLLWYGFFYFVLYEKSRSSPKK